MPLFCNGYKQSYAGETTQLKDQQNFRVGFLISTRCQEGGTGNRPDCLEGVIVAFLARPSIGSACFGVLGVAQPLVVGIVRGTQPFSIR